MTYHKAIILTRSLALLLACFLAYDMAYAGELYLDAAGGLAHFQITTPDGDYLQQGLEHKLDLRSVAYRVGLGWRFNEQWSIQAGYVNLGTINQTAKFVTDADYDASTGKCLANCETASTYRMTDAYKGWELTATRTLHLDTNWSLDLKAGGAILKHRFTLTKQDGSGQADENNGRFLAAVLGGGVCYKVFCAESIYYQGVGGYCAANCQWAMSQAMLVTLVSVKVPLW